MAEIQGTIDDDRFLKMGDLLQSTLTSGEDVGASVCVTLGGETVVDIWGGTTGQSPEEPGAAAWQADTITNVWSTTKTMTFLAGLTMVEKGLLDLYAPVAEYWPEFAANGKDKIEVRQLFGHTSGVSGWDQPVTVEDIYDWDKSTSMLAAQAPWWEPGTASGYHALNQGHLIGEVIRRIDGRTLGPYFAEEVAGPLGADFHIGLADTEFGRIANVIPPPPLPTPPGEIDMNSPAIKTFTGPAPDAATSWEADWRKAEIGAANGHGNARSVAEIQAIVANGGTLGDVTLLSPETIELIFDEQSHGIDLVLGLPVRFGMGYALPSEAAPQLPSSGRVAYWGGWGGSSIIVDVDRNMTIAYMMNRMAEGLLGDMRGFNLVVAAYDAVT